jgi:hypothetical protein
LVEGYDIALMNELKMLDAIRKAYPGKKGGQVFILDRFRPSVKNEDPYVFLTL